MHEIIRIIATTSVLWALVALIMQFMVYRGKGRKDFSVRAGSPMMGVLYNFTVAMTPRHKESIRNHPAKFIIGVVMHVGVFVAIVKTLWLLILPDSAPIFPLLLGSLAVLSAACGLFLFVRRILSPTMHAMSSPDDYLSVLVTIGFIAAGALHEFGIITSVIFLIVSAVVFFYLPIGKLKHALFFFIARADFGARLGYRNTYPAARKSGP